MKPITCAPNLPLQEPSNKHSLAVSRDKTQPMSLSRHLRRHSHCLRHCRPLSVQYSNWGQSPNLGTSQQAKGSCGCPEGLVVHPSFSGQVCERPKSPPSQPSTPVALLILVVCLAPLSASPRLSTGSHPRASTQTAINAFDDSPTHNQTHSTCCAPVSAESA